MKTRRKIGFGIYLLGGILGIFWGFLYFFASEMMPYHRQAIGKNWGDLEKGTQIIILALMQDTGAGWLAFGLMWLITLFIPFRRGEKWANWTLFVCGVFLQTLLFFVTMKVHIMTQASTPWYFALFFIVLIFVAFLLSLPEKKELQP
jgi:hypothetical protein